MADESAAGLSPVERRVLEASPFAALCPPAEKIRTLVVDNFPALGKLAAMRFVEWVQDHPGGVISLPTGKTPEHFIRWVQRLLQGWDTPQIRRELEEAGVDPGCRPDMGSLHFVQIDEFYPIAPAQHNSFHSYVSRFYLEGFGLDPRRALLIDGTRIGLPPGHTLRSAWPADEVDLSLRYRAAHTPLEQFQQRVLAGVDQWCQDFESRVRQLGGIGFFLGGIGPDGHIGFNVRGSDHRSTTRLTAVNYQTQASAAGDLGGIEVARKRLVITIGLGTITYNPDCCAIVIAAGEAKAQIVAAAVQEQAHIDHPATSLQVLPQARFYLTLGAAKLLEERQVVLLERTPVLDEEEIEKVVVDLAVARRKRVDQLGQKDFAADLRGALLLRRCPGPVEVLTGRVRASLIAKLERGMSTRSQTRFLHTEPHHDDLMLGYLPYIVRHVRQASNTHHFVCLTGGFTAVTNRFIQDHLARLGRFLDTPQFARLHGEGYFVPDNENGRNRDVWQYLDGVAADDEDLRAEGAARRFLRNLLGVYGEEGLEGIRRRMAELEAYFAAQYPGQKDAPQVQQLKSLCREWEAECIWGYFGWDCPSIRHLRLGFYTGEVFTREPTVEGDVVPILKLLEEVRPDVVGVALDPEASGPDTHYKVLQAIAEALRRYQGQSGRADLRVLGYRNVWYRFHPAEANIFVPVSLNMFAIMHNAFMNTFISQKDASFPSYEHEGPFSELAQRIQVEQYQKVKICLGRQWFHEHPSPLIRATRGLVFLKDLSLEEFYARSRQLQAYAERG
ncbi:MAG: glucosamine-6-phosphate deaminase [Candidatus Latescibacteria bacterium]|nr:glucosamine-6-phosphate deaminase [Candidatus Latescibacterota bacterium]